jgi:GNAT superfamily N-acetyltransferase
MPTTHQPVLRIERTAIGSPTAQALITALNAELSALYCEPGANHFRLDVEEVAPGCGAFLVAWRDDVAIGCGAIRTIEPGVGEIKRMYVKPEARGRGIGRAMVAALEAQAKALGLVRVVLETGERQPDAIALYQRVGFTRIAPYGEYAESPCTVCMEKVLGR